MAKLTRTAAVQLLEEWTNSESLLIHARAVEAVMRAAAASYAGSDASPEYWGLAGLLHDADYDQWPEQHPTKIVAWLREHNEEELAYAISCHYTKWGFTTQNQMDAALLACDELTGFVMACALVRPEGISTLTVKSVKKKLKTKSFAASVDRDEIRIGTERLGVDLDAHIQFVINALQPFASEFRIGGTQ